MALVGARWQHECETVGKRCGYVLTSGLWSDCIFMVGLDTNQEVIRAHKLVLAMASPVFEAMFFGGLSDRNDRIIRIPDIQPEAFRALLQYICTGDINIGSFDVAWDVFYGAKKYMLPHLEKECNRYICSVLVPENVCRAYEIALFFDDKTVMDESLKIISTKTDMILNDSSFEDVELNTVITVFSLDHLNVDSELELFHALTRFAEAEQQRQGPISLPVDGEPPSKKLCNGLESSTSEEKVLLSVECSPVTELELKHPAEICSEPTADKQNLKEEEPTIRTALQKIRFLSMTALEFARAPALSDLLTRDESFSVLINILRRDRPVPMPTGFSECRMRRQRSCNTSMNHDDKVKQCIKDGCFEHTIKALKCGDPLEVRHAAWAASDILSSFDDVYGKRALDKGLLEALVPALTAEDSTCKYNAARAIFFLCARGSPAQRRTLAEGTVLQPYCHLLADDEGFTCDFVLRGLTHLLKYVVQNTKHDLVLKLREIGVPQLLLTVRQSGNVDNRGLADNLLRTYFSGGQ